MLRIIEDYVIVTSEKETEMTKIIIMLSKKGYEMQGGTSLDSKNNKAVQAMVKYKD